ncbi:MAG: RNA polymerase factor sigma-32 [Deltaproteobacteria bacterium]|nr:RNA polymerase factor sigma-32 [Deltaproteobacteria bacterium]
MKTTDTLDDLDVAEEVLPESEQATGILHDIPATYPQVPGAFDPLRRYLYEIGKYALLTREEETSLAIRYQEKGDQDAAYRLVTANLRLVVKIAMEFQNYWMRNLQDLIQEGNVGLMQALRKFDPYRGVKFSYYASYWIKAYILKFIMDNWHLVRVGTTQTQRKLFYNLKKEKERLLSEGMEPGPKLLADRLQVTERDIIEMDQRLEGREISLDAPLSDDTDDSHMAFLVSQDEAQDDLLADAEMRELLLAKLDEFRQSLSERDRILVERRILAEHPATLQEMGETFGVSRERVRQLEERLKKRVRQFLTEELPDLEGHNFLTHMDQHS